MEIRCDSQVQFGYQLISVDSRKLRGIRRQSQMLTAYTSQSCANNKCGLPASTLYAIVIIIIIIISVSLMQTVERRVSIT